LEVDDDPVKPAPPGGADDHQTVLPSRASRYPSRRESFVSLPALSICIPTFNRLGYLREAVASARRQTLQEIEIVIGDDGDSAEIGEWCRTTVAEDGRIRYEKTPRRLGLAGNWNFLTSLARAPYLTLMGDDDRLLPTFAQTLLRLADGDSDVVFCNHHIIDSRGRRLDDVTRATTERYGRAALAPGPLKEPAKLTWGSVIAMSASIVKVEAVRRLGFKNDMNTPDLELFVRLAGNGGKFVFVDEYLVEYRAHGDSATTAGLTTDRLAEHLERVPVPIDVEPAKRACLEPLFVSGVGVRLRRGDSDGARALLRSSYYPRSSLRPRPLVQRLVLMLPGGVISPIYTSLGRVARALRQIGSQRAT
jgi:GT2 family glycosyltransferase